MCRNYTVGFREAVENGLSKEFSDGNNKVPWMEYQKIWALVWVLPLTGGMSLDMSFVYSLIKHLKHWVGGWGQTAPSGPGVT